MASLIFISLYAIGLVQNFEKPLSPGYFFKSMLLLPQSTSPILGPGWTLVHEVKFYLMYIFIVTVWYRNYLLGLALWGLLSFAVFSASLFKVGFLDNHIVGRAANYFFHPMSLEFIGGVFLAKYRHQISGWISSKWMLVLISLLALAVISGLSDLKYGKGPGVVKYYSVLLYFPVALLLLAACVSLEQIGKLKVRQFWVKLGDASYSTYLIHRPMLKVVVPVFAALGISTIFANAVAFVAVCLVVQFAAYYYFVRFDNKLYEYLRKKL